MKNKKEDKILRKLFRQRLEQAEIIPSQVCEDQLFRRLGRKEFLRFDPFRFNIWYVAGIAAAAALILFMTAGTLTKSAESCSDIDEKMTGLHQKRG